MDAGDGQNNNGDIVDRYRIYLGGCSNGGYMSMNLTITYPNFFAATYQTCEANAYMVFKRDENGSYVHLKNNPSPTAVVQTNERWFTDDKMNLIKNLPIWLISSADDDTFLPHLFSLPTYKQLLKIGHKNAWFSFFKNFEGADIKGMKYNGHWS